VLSGGKDSNAPLAGAKVELAVCGKPPFKGESAARHPTKVS